MPTSEPRVLKTGAPLDAAGGAMILLHGRGGSAEDILGLADEVEHRAFAYLAPAAPGNAWYPNSFMTPIEKNEPWLSRSLQVIDRIVADLVSHGLPRTQLILLGFSQGACLALEYASRNPMRYGGLVGLSGGLIGAPGTRWISPGEFSGTPVLLGCSERDPFIPVSRVEETAEVFRAAGAKIDLRLYPGGMHGVVPDELTAIRQMMEEVVGTSQLPS